MRHPKNFSAVCFRPRAVAAIATSAGVLAILLHGSAGTAQVTPLLVPGEGYHIAIDPAGSGPTEPFTRSVSGFFQEDGVVDIVYLRGNRPRLLFSPALYDAGALYPEIANDIATLPGTAPGGGDELLTVGDGGLKAWTRNPDQTFSERPLGSALWTGARIVRVGFLDDHPQADILGVTSDGLTVILLSNSDTPDASETTFSLPSVALDLVTYHRDTDGQSDLAILTQNGLLLYDIGDPNPLAFFPSLAPGGAIVAVTNPRTPVERLIWITQTASGEDGLHRIRGTAISPATNLGFLSTVAAAAGDFDLDGDDDIVLSHKSSWNVVFLKNPGRAPGSDSGSRSIFDSGGPDGAAPTNEAWPVVVDLEGDGDVDVVFPVLATEQLFIFRNRNVNHAQQAPDLAEVRFGHDRPRNQTYLRIAFENPPHIPDAATHVEFTFFRKANPNTPTHPISFKRFLVPRRAGRFYPPATVFLQESQTKFPAIYFWFQRFVHATGQGPDTQFLDVYPARIYGFTTEIQFLSPAGPSYNYLTGLSGSGPPAPVLFDTNVAAGLFPGSLSVGTVVEEKPIPDYPEEEEPILTVFDR